MTAEKKAFKRMIDALPTVHNSTSHTTTRPHDPQQSASGESDDMKSRLLIPMRVIALNKRKRKAL